MRTFTLFVAFALLSLNCFAQGPDGETAPFNKQFSLELSTGIQPLHMTLAPSYDEEKALAKQGMTFDDSDAICVPINITEVWRVRPHWELCLTEGICWKYAEVYTYSNFGIDPNGNPRYDYNYNNRIPAGHKATLPIGSLTFQVRFIWVPRWKVTMYSALGVGLTTATSLVPLPGITPIAVRFGGEHLYFFAEATLGPIATLGHGGIGWKF